MALILKLYVVFIFLFLFFVASKANGIKNCEHDLTDCEQDSDCKCIVHEIPETETLYILPISQSETLYHKYSLVKPNANPK
ncbi:unnamed protein product [Lathyrus oleraceus]